MPPDEEPELPDEPELPEDPDDPDEPEEKRLVCDFTVTEGKMLEPSKRPHVDLDSSQTRYWH